MRENFAGCTKSRLLAAVFSMFFIMLVGQAAAQQSSSASTAKARRSRFPSGRK